MGAGNEWINGYLEAILDAGGAAAKLKNTNNKNNHVSNGTAGVKLMKLAKFEEMMMTTTSNEHQKEDGDHTFSAASTSSSSTCTDNKLFSPTTYFVEEVINSFDESDLHRTWVKVTATRNTRERSNRLENLCWRIWHLARKKKQIAWDDAQKLASRRVEREQGRNDIADDLSELSEGDKEQGDAIPTEISAKEITTTATQIWTDEEKPRHLYIVLISMHGLVRGENMELGRDSDTGGQVKYVVELARALANTRGVYRVDLLTRQITSPEIDSSYGEPIEMLSYPQDDGSGSCGAYIIRIPCGPPNKYVAKESLWPYVPEFVDGALNHIVNMARALGEQVNGGGKEPTWPYVIHGHYADAGEVAAYLSGALEVPMVLTGHSLGRNKFEQLLKQGRLSREDINRTYKILRRTEAEEFALDAAQIVVTSTRQEIEEQWGLYDGFDLKLERKLRVRRRRGVSCMGRYMPRMVVIPPGMDFSYVTAQDSSEDDLKSLVGSDKTPKKVHLPPIWSEIMRFFTNPHKPTILALSRPDPKKNMTTLIKAFGENQSLRELANLTLILGNRDDIEDMSSTPSVVLTTVLKLIDKYDLYGQVAYPKHHKQSEVPDIYRFAARTKGVFINPALVEPFGLTLIEAAAYGLPIVATKNGGPVDILKALNNGILVDPHDQKAITDALLKLLADKNLWNECRRNGLRNIQRFSWPEHCRNYLSHIEHCRNSYPRTQLEISHMPQEPMTESLKEAEDLSLRFSIEGDFKSSSELDAETKHKKFIEAVALIASPNGSPIVKYNPGRREMLFVIATDCYNSNGETTGQMQDIIKNVLKAAGLTLEFNKVGFVLLTGSSLAETMEILRSCPVNAEDFDAIICNSGGELYYPWRDMVADMDYEAHVAYRWPGDNIRPMVIKLIRVNDEVGEEDTVEFSEVGGSRCYSYSIKPGAKIQNVDNLRQRLRMRGFRCNLVYTREATRLNVVPLFASRVQALRYLSIRWGMDLSKVVVVVGERGDTDHEQLLGGLHKTLIIRGSAQNDSENQHRDADNLKREDSVLFESPNIHFIEERYDAQHITAALEALGVK